MTKDEAIAELMEAASVVAETLEREGEWVLSGMLRRAVVRAGTGEDIYARYPKEED